MESGNPGATGNFPASTIVGTQSNEAKYMVTMSTLGFHCIDRFPGLCMFASSTAIASLLTEEKTKNGLKKTKHTTLSYKFRRSPRRRSKNMPIATIEHTQYEIIKDELVFRVIEKQSRIPREDKSYKFISINSWFSYPDFKLYYGPSNIIHVIKFIEMVQIYKAQSPEKVVCVVERVGSDQLLNAILLTSAYLVLIKDMSPHDAYDKVFSLLAIAPKSYYKTEGEEISDDVHISILHCLKGLKTFIELELVDLDAIDIEEASMREYPLNGDMNWIIPGKILALAGPTTDLFGIEEFIEYAKVHGIVSVIRLNRVHYESSRLGEHDIEHHEMFINDGNIPTPAMIVEFCKIAEDALRRGALAVHCRAGLGRTGTMIGIYLIHKYGLQATDVIAYLRMMRPGSVLGMQARYLETYMVVYLHLICRIQYVLRNEPPPEEVAEQLNVYYSGEPKAFEEVIRRMDPIVERPARIPTRKLLKAK